MDNKSLPFSVEILFENYYLDILNFLCILSVFRSKWSGIKIREFSFYYSIIISQDNIAIKTKELNNVENIKYDIQSLYINFEKKMKKIILYLYHLDFIEITKKDIKKFNNNKIKITDKGQEIIDSLESNYFIELINNTKKIISYVKYTKKNEEKILGV